MRNLYAYQKTASRFSLAFLLGVFSLWLAAFWEAKCAEIRVVEMQAAEKLRRAAFEEQEITCLANIVYHEVRGENKGVRELSAKVVLASISDPAFPRHTVCSDAEHPGRFSGLKEPRKVRFADPLWSSIWWHMNEVYYGPRTLPRGWQCVRAFRASDDYMEKLSDRAIRQLGITVSAKGMKYFAASNVPVDTRGTVTFYSHRRGCSHPSPTT